jgi:DNA-binding transcriptional ArsR family regulator
MTIYWNIEASDMKTPTKLRLTELGALGQAAECLRILAHPHRLRMIQMLLQGDYTVGELAESCDLPTAMASEHLRLMQRCGFLTSQKQGRKVYYRVAEPHLKSILKCVEERFGVSIVSR